MKEGGAFVNAIILQRGNCAPLRRSVLSVAIQYQILTM